MSLSDEIKMIRQRSLMSQTEFANRLNVSYTTVNRWEAGRARPNLIAMKEIRDFCAEQEIEYKPIETAWLESRMSIHKAVRDGGGA